MIYEVEVYFDVGTKQLGCETVQVKANNRAEAEIRARGLVESYNSGKVKKIKTRIIYEKNTSN